jgi:mono/diheme cytochrome c family protein
MTMSKFLAAVSAAAIFACSSAYGAAAPEALAQGEYVARAGDCIVCHTAPGGESFAGGLKMATPLGVITTTNITPDRDTGIGAYSFADFDRAMRKGIAKDGHYLFPAMPYPSYANMTDTDMKALYAFFQESVAPVKRANDAKDLPKWMNKDWVLNTGLAVWNTVFVPGKGYTAKTEKGMAWNRGAYLVEGLGHCGSCHTPRGAFFQEKAMTGEEGAFMSGAELDHWSAPNLRGDAGDGLGSWTEADLAVFLKTGHGPGTAAFGTMIDVINNSTQYLTDDDLAGMAAYIKSLTPGARPGSKPPVYDTKTTDRLIGADDKTPGEKTYSVQCAGCHGMDGKGKGDFVPPIAGNPAVLDRNPASLINVTLNGSQRIVVGGQPDAYRMVQFRVLLNDQQTADVVNFIRSGWGNNASTTVKPEDVAKVRKDTDPASDQVVILRMR